MGRQESLQLRLSLSPSNARFAVAKTRGEEHGWGHGTRYLPVIPEGPGISAQRGTESGSLRRKARSCEESMASSAGDRSLSRPMRGEPKVRRGDETHQDDARQQGSAENSNGQLAFCRVHPCRLRVRLPVLVALETRPAEARQPIHRGINALRRRRHPQSPSADCVAIDSQ
ncbi:hypothetical protein THAOC_11744 [Thalassiosira oceanica]|uniref:Uncharacterized protein n=1 Tax=Thalassiosira oceanica TaxID=159749 RepID=K0SPM3_THAOC|nr:hypothetical protein THAOC_11744 [Thalassiosira oceanica]|eukprot:EJK67250.1 hypothetical protein THAOC_11744 [Thalassiosira oceanica]